MPGGGPARPDGRGPVRPRGAALPGRRVPVLGPSRRAVAQ